MHVDVRIVHVYIRNHIAFGMVRNNAVATPPQLKPMVPCRSSGNGTFAICSDTTRGKCRESAPSAAPQYTLCTYVYTGWYIKHFRVFHEPISPARITVSASAMQPSALQYRYCPIDDAMTISVVSPFCALQSLTYPFADARDTTVAAL